jgi:bifunctional ADP-heptose synthase (sugar kinase/adenylyltransferase)
MNSLKVYSHALSNKKNLNGVKPNSCYILALNHLKWVNVSMFFYEKNPTKLIMVVSKHVVVKGPHKFV